MHKTHTNSSLSGIMISHEACSDKDQACTVWVTCCWGQSPNRAGSSGFRVHPCRRWDHPWPCRLGEVLRWGCKIVVPAGFSVCSAWPAGPRAGARAAPCRPGRSRAPGESSAAACDGPLLSTVLPGEMAALPSTSTCKGGSLSASAMGMVPSEASNACSCGPAPAVQLFANALRQSAHPATQVTACADAAGPDQFPCQASVSEVVTVLGW